MRRFETQEIKNGWLLCYYTEYEGEVKRYFQDMEEIVYILNSIMTEKTPDKSEHIKLRNKPAKGD